MRASASKRRALGQHFLRDARLCESIAEAALSRAAEAGCRSLLEIGPGRGAITRPLLAGLARGAVPGVDELILSEADRGLAAGWKAEHAPLRVHEGDFLALDEAAWLGRPPLAVASNLPYSAGTAIVTRLARHPARIPVMVLMFQAEVARRLRAEPDTREWGNLSVWIQNRWEVCKLFHVSPGAFAPPPKVDSEVVVLTPRPEPRVAVSDEARWEQLLKVSFAHRRKMLRSGLPATGPWRNALELSGVDGRKRSESLGWDEWRSFYEALSRVAPS
jgi:16S rRNA (adenine1518-N6/adenine1519-N6)-dimethyltransferase